MFFSLIIIAIIFSANNSEANTDGIYKAQNGEHYLFLKDSFLIDNYNVFCMQSIKYKNSNYGIIDEQCSCMNSNGFYEKSYLLKHENSVSICGEDTITFHKKGNINQTSEVNSVTINILNKPPNFPYYTIKVIPNSKIFLDGIQYEDYSQESKLFNIDHTETVYMDEDFMPGRPIIQIEIFLETGIQKEIKLYGWLNAPIEIQVFLMDIMSRSLRANAK